MPDRKRQNTKKPAPITARESGQKPEMVTVAQGSRPAQIKGKSRRKAGRPPLEAPNLERRDSIAAAALKLFSEIGFAAVSNKELGETAGIQPALIYYYFKDKNDLFHSVVSKALT